MNQNHKQRIKQRDERGTVEYWRQRALAAEARLAQRFDRQPVPELNWKNPLANR